MATRPAEQAASVERIALIRVVLDALERPALVVQAPDTVVVANAAWQDLFTDSACSHAQSSLTRWLGTLEGADSIAAALRATADDATPRTAKVTHCSGGVTRPFDVRVLPVPASRSGGPVHLLTMTELSSPAMSDSGSASAHHTRRLLVRQTLIEERERRRLGQALHDQVTQLLVQLRRHLAELRDNRGADECVAMIGEVDSVIHVLRELTFAFSPPVLEDLGLLPALQWLAEHLRESYGAEVRCTDDGVEPLLSSDARTIAFRAVRELSNNAVKHAPGSSIRLRSGEEGECYRIEVEDDGPGFSEGNAPDMSQQLPGYGLLSIEQQIRAIGGTFEIRSHPGSGTRATITLPTTSLPECEETDNA